MRKLLLTATALACLATPALADPWYILDGETNQCVHRTDFTSPAAMHLLLRSEHVVDTVHVHKNDDQQVLYVVVETPRYEVYFFPSLMGCTIARKMMIEDGTIPDPKDIE